MSETSNIAKLTCVATILGGHGVHGAVKIKSFTAIPADFSTYGPLLDEAGNIILTPKNPRPVGKHFTFRSEEIKTREEAEALKGLHLYVPREALPEPENEDEFYYSDLIGLDVKTTDGRRAGTVKAVHAFGAGDMLEIQPGKSEKSDKTWFHPFTKTAVPKVDLRAGRVIIHIEDAIMGRDPNNNSEDSKEPPSEVSLDTPQKSD